MRAARTLALLLPLAAGCFSAVVNPGASATLPFHPHHDVLRQASPVDGAPLAARAPARPVAVQPLVGYYPRPFGLVLRAVDGEVAKRAWEPLPADDLPPEERLSQALFRALPGTGAPAAVTLGGVVTELAFYRWDGGAGGVVSTRLTLIDAGGRLLAEEDLRTVGRAESLAQLFDAHVRRCLADPAFAAALWPAGGAP